MNYIHGVCVCVCVCVGQKVKQGRKEGRKKESKKKRDKHNHLILLVVYPVVCVGNICGLII